MDKIISAILVVIALVNPALAETPVDQLHTYISEASSRFGIPEDWVSSVIMAESGGDTKAVSPKGAMGLMQLMPDTWEAIKSSHSLGPDPFDTRDNIIAGTSYLRAMFDRFGYPALFSAYNAGEGRYEDHLRTGKPLPEETHIYVERIGKRLDFTAQDSVKTASGARLFFALSTVPGEAFHEPSSTETNGLFVRVVDRKAGVQ